MNPRHGNSSWPCWGLPLFLQKQAKKMTAMTLVELAHTHILQFYAYIIHFWNLWIKTFHLIPNSTRLWRVSFFCSVFYANKFHYVGFNMTSLSLWHSELWDESIHTSFVKIGSLAATLGWNIQTYLHRQIYFIHNLYTFIHKLYILGICELKPFLWYQTR